MEMNNDARNREKVNVDNYRDENEINKNTMLKFLNCIRVEQKGIMKLGIILLVLIVIINLFFPRQIYKRVNWTGQSSTSDTKIILKANGSYKKNGGSENGTYDANDKKIILHPENGDKDITYIKSGKYLYCDRGWFEDDSPYFEEKIEAGRKIDQTLSYISYGNTGIVNVWIERTLKLYSSGEYVYIENSSVFGNKFELREKGKYKRRNKELVLKSDDGKKRIMPIVNGKVVYIEVYKK